MLCVAGIDPGITGAVAVVTSAGTAEVWDMPTNSGGWVCTRAMPASLRSALSTVQHVGVEMVRSRPGQGVSSTFKFGHGYGQACAMAEMAGWGEAEVLHVSPQIWQGSFDLLGESKDAGRVLAVNLFPELADQLARKKDHGRAEALLIAWFVLHQYGGFDEPVAIN